jgi:hypothetical protein
MVRKPGVEPGPASLFTLAPFPEGLSRMVSPQRIELQSRAYQARALPLSYGELGLSTGFEPV